MLVGYSFWGFLGDKKYDKEGNKISTPDGNAFYSWSIISELQRRKNDVVLIMPDRDKVGYKLNGDELFRAFAKEKRNECYNRLLFSNNNTMFMDYAIIEWRWEIKGRNDEETRINNYKEWQPDLAITKYAINFCNCHGIPFVVFDLDYKLTEEDVIKYDIKYVIELGTKWKDSKLVKSKQVKIPFDFNCINEFGLRLQFDNSLVYVGNRYERDWCIDKYIPEDLEDCMIYGNWKESGRDSEERWENLKFGNRLQTSDMQFVYSRSVATILLAKEEYCKQGFMTARIIEAVFYGTVPLFISEYGKDVIEEYAGKYSEFLTVNSKEEVKEKLNILKNNVQTRNDVIRYLRRRLRFMHCEYFINDVEKLLLKSDEEGWGK